MCDRETRTGTEWRRVVEGCLGQRNRRDAGDSTEIREFVGQVQVVESRFEEVAEGVYQRERAVKSREH